MNRLALALVCALACGVAVRPYVGAGIRAVVPHPPSLEPLDPVAWRAKVEHFEHLDRAAGPHVVYLGDSITERMNVAEFALPGHTRILNRGIAGDTTRGVLARVRRSFPRETTVCFLLIGYNDLRRGGTPEGTAQAVQAIAEYLIADRGVEHVVVEALLPPGNETFAAVIELNSRLERWTRGRGQVSFLDLFSAFLGPDGKPNPEFFVDAVHLSGAGALRRVAMEVEHLGRIDRAPPLPSPGAASSPSRQPGTDVPVRTPAGPRLEDYGRTRR